MRTALVLVVALGFVTAACGDPSPTERAARERSAQISRLARDAGLDDAVSELLVTAAGAVSATFRATYELTDADGRRSSVTVTQRPPDRRIDLTPAGAESRTSLTTSGRSFVCLEDGGAWRCQEGEPPPELGGFAVDDLEATVAALGDAALDYDLSVAADEIAGVAVTCLVAELRSGRGDPTLGDLGRLCVTDDGVLAAVERPASTLRLTSLEAEVAADAFDLPADPVVR